MKKIITGTLLTCALATADGNIAAVEEEVTVPVVTEENSAWKQQLVIYGWLPTLSGTLTYQLQDGSKEESDSSAIDNLDAVFMATYEVRKDKWSFLADAIYLGMSGGETIRDGRVQTTFDQEFTAWLLSFYGGYNTIDTGRVTLDVIAGMRYFSLDIDASLTFEGPLGRNPSISISPSVEVYDAVVGIKGSVDINENWYIPFLFDIGAGDSDLTWQGQASLAYRFGWGDVLATYRYVHYESDGIGLVNDFDMYGPKVGVVFHF